jgi:hypothetical protein
MAGTSATLQPHPGHRSVETTEVCLRFIAQQAENAAAQKAAQLQRFGEPNRAS